MTQGIGARIQRKEDARHLHGRGNFVSDMILPGQSEVAFLRSPIAHGRIRRIVKPPGAENQVFIRADLDDVGEGEVFEATEETHSAARPASGERRAASR